MAQQGWIKLHRQILDNPVVCKDSEYFAVWCYLLLEATHQDKSIVFSGERITLHQGQLITGRKSISEKFNIDESKVQRILKTLENEHQIVQQTSNKNRLITIVNWQMYQENEQQNEQQMNNKCTTSEQQVNTNKNVKNDKNEITNKSYSASELSSEPVAVQNVQKVFESVWAIYPNKKGKARVSDKAKKEIAKIGLNEMTRAVKRYNDVLKQDSWRQPQDGRTFFTSGYVDYLDANYTPPEPRGKPRQAGNLMDNFYHAQEDYSRLEQ